MLSPAATTPKALRAPGTPRSLPKTPPDETIPKELTAAKSTAAESAAAESTAAESTAAIESLQVPSSNAEWKEAYKMLEARFLALEERMRGEVMGLKDRLEEEVAERKRLERKLEETMVQTRPVPETHDEADAEWKRGIKEVEERIMGKIEEENKKKKKRCIIITDSNGRRGVTPSSVKYHMPEEDRDSFDISLVIAYRIGEAASLVEKGDLAIQGAVVIVDCLGNDARQTRKEPKLSPDRHVQELDKLRQKLWQKGAAKVIVCSVKPTQRADVSEYVERVHRYLKSVEDVDGGHGCHSQVRLEHLGADGLHLQPRHYWVLQQTYAYALLAKNVPDPTPLDGFTPNHMRQAYRTEWPLAGSNGRGAGRAPLINHGWNR